MRTDILRVLSGDCSRVKLCCTMSQKVRCQVPGRERSLVTGGPKPCRSASAGLAASVAEPKAPRKTSAVVKTHCTHSASYRDLRPAIPVHRLRQTHSIALIASTDPTASARRASLLLSSHRPERHLRPSFTSGRNIGRRAAIAPVQKRRDNAGITNPRVWTAPSWQGLSSRRRSWSVRSCVRPLVRRGSHDRILRFNSGRGLKESATSPPPWVHTESTSAPQLATRCAALHCALGETFARTAAYCDPSARASG